MMVDQIAHGLALSVNKFLPKEKQLEEKLTKKTARRLGNIRNKLARTPEELLHFLKAKEKKIQDSSYLQGKRESDKTGFAFNWSWDTFNLDFFKRLLKGQYTDFESRTNSKTKLELEIKALERKNEERQRRESEISSLAQQIRSIRNDFLRDLHYEVASRFGGKAYIQFCNDINAVYDSANKRFALTAKDTVIFAKWYPKLERLCGHVMGFDSFSVSGLTILAYGKRTVS